MTENCELSRLCSMDSVRFVLLCLAGWINRQQQDAIAYMQDEVAVLREQLGPKRPRFTVAQSRRLAAGARKLKFGKLKEIASVIRPQTLFAWRRKLIPRNTIRVRVGLGDPERQSMLRDWWLSLRRRILVGDTAQLKEH